MRVNEITLPPCHSDPERSEGEESLLVIASPRRGNPFPLPETPNVIVRAKPEAILLSLEGRGLR